MTENSARVNAPDIDVDSIRSIAVLLAQGFLGDIEHDNIEIEGKRPSLLISLELVNGAATNAFFHSGESATFFSKRFIESSNSSVIHQEGAIRSGNGKQIALRTVLYLSEETASSSNLSLEFANTFSRNADISIDSRYPHSLTTPHLKVTVERPTWIDRIHISMKKKGIMDDTVQTLLQKDLIEMAPLNCPNNLTIIAVPKKTVSDVK
eukprot:IDg17205t1